MEVLEFLRAAIREREWTIPQFAKAAHVSIGLAYKWLSEDPAYRITPSPTSCEKIADALGIDPDVMLELAGHRRRRGERTLNTRAQAIQDQVERWIAAVGPHYEEYFWRHLKAQGDSMAAVLRDIGSAVSASDAAAVNPGVSAPRGAANQPDDDSGRALRSRYHPAREPLATAALNVHAAAAA